MYHGRLSSVINPGLPDSGLGIFRAEREGRSTFRMIQILGQTSLSSSGCAALYPLIDHRKDYDLDRACH